jgi:aspartate/methionine/tyrosine aminotransferase
MDTANRLSGISEYYFAAKLAEIQRMHRDGNNTVLNLGIGSPDLPPSSTVIEILKKALNEHGAHAYQPYRGTDFLRTAIQNWYREWFDVTLRADSEILPLMGSKEGIMNITMSFVNPGDQVLIPNPGYPSYRSCTLIAGGIPVSMNLTKERGWKPDFDVLGRMHLEKLKLIWLNYPNMPTGAKADIGFFKEAVAFAKTYGALLCHDNPYVFLLNQNPLSMLQADGSFENILELTSLSKCYNMAGWRVGALCGHQKHISAVMSFRSQMDSGMFRPIQNAAATALALSRDWTDELNAVYYKRQKIGYEIMNALGLETQPEAAGLFLWGKIKKPHMHSEEFSNFLLQKARVFITPGHIFGSAGDHYLRVSLCSSESDLEEALSRIESLHVYKQSFI